MWILLILAGGGCIRGAADQADASTSAFRAEIGELSAALGSVRSELRAGRDVNQNDKWTLRLLGLGVLMLGLSYPVGKIIWLASGLVHRKARWMILSAARQDRHCEASQARSAISAS